MYLDLCCDNPQSVIAMEFPKELNCCLNDLIASVSKATGMISQEQLAEYTARFRELGFVQIPRIVDSQCLARTYKLIEEFIDNNSVLFERPERPDLNRQLTGFRMRRVFLETHLSGFRNDLTNEYWLEQRRELVLFVNRLSKSIMPLIEEVAGDCSYKYSTFFLYYEGDYAGLHNDAEMGKRINAQMPLSLDTIGGIRILENEKLHMHYDSPGCLNILGPKVWHDVPPVLRLMEDRRPKRVNLTLRFIQNG
jgi:hypothetical protein